MIVLTLDSMSPPFERIMSLNPPHEAFPWAKPSILPMLELEGCIRLLEGDDWASAFPPLTSLAVKDELVVAMVEFRDTQKQYNILRKKQ